MGTSSPDYNACISPLVAREHVTEVITPGRLCHAAQPLLQNLFGARPKEAVQLAACHSAANPSLEECVVGIAQCAPMHSQSIGISGNPFVFNGQQANRLVFLSSPVAQRNKSGVGPQESGAVV